VDNLLAVVTPAAGNAVTRIDLNAHVDRGSDPSQNLAEREASVSQPGMVAWEADGSHGYLVAIGSRKLFRVEGACASGACVLGPDRASPVAVEVGEGPTGVVLHEAHDRAYVLNRISHSIAVVRASTMAVLDEVPLHDPSPAATRDGRRFLYDAIDTSAHGDASCASCHVSGDLDGLAWDLGDPEGELAPYAAANDNVRFVIPVDGQPVECPPSLCASHEGFDPQKGPMTTQTLRGMLEPLHWRGDRATVNDFNAAFVGLLGKEDVGPIDGKPAGLSAADMELFRQFALAIAFPPNPHRRVDDTTPCGTRAQDPSCEVLVHGALFPGNPTEGRRIFDVDPTAAGQPCQSCHAHPFGAGGGTLGGVTPTEPTSPAVSALFNGDADGSPHSDLEIPHLRNLHEKIGPVLAAPGSGTLPETASGFGYVHDGSMPDLYRFLSASVFDLSAANQARAVRDVAAFLFHFPTGTKPAVGRQVTLPPGLPPTGPVADESLLGALVTLGDQANAARHCELVATARAGGRERAWRLASGTWQADVAGEPALTTAQLRSSAASPVTFTCVPLGSGARLGGNRDEDMVADGDDCAPGDPLTWHPAQTVAGLAVAAGGRVSWSAPSPDPGPSLALDVLGGSLEALRASGLPVVGCIEGDVAGASWVDPGVPPPGEGRFYLLRASNPCGVASLGAGRDELEGIVCP
jgi:hypothetical protein